MTAARVGPPRQKGEKGIPGAKLTPDKEARSESTPSPAEAGRPEEAPDRIASLKVAIAQARWERDKALKEKKSLEEESRRLKTRTEKAEKELRSFAEERKRLTSSFYKERKKLAAEIESLRRDLHPRREDERIESSNELFVQENENAKPVKFNFR